MRVMSFLELHDACALICPMCLTDFADQIEVGPLKSRIGVCDVCGAAWILAGVGMPLRGHVVEEGSAPARRGCNSDDGTDT
jgi:hypothetical protein